MLVLTRKDGEQLRIGDAVVKLVESHTGIVTLGIEAPRDVLIVRLDERGRDQRKRVK